MGFSASIILGNLQDFEDLRQRIIEGLDSAQAEATGWDAEVKAKLAASTVVRTSNTVVTITLSAQAAYNITAQETITCIIPAIALNKKRPVTATPTFTVDFVAGGASKVPNMMNSYRRRRS